LNVLRSIFGAISLGSALFGVGRQVARKHIDSEITKQIDAAADEARARVKTHTAEYLNEAWKAYFISCAIKVGLLLALVALVIFAGLAKPVGALLAAVLLVFGFAYDVSKRRKEIWQVFTLARQHGLNIKKIARSIVAKSVFEEVLSHAKDSKVSRLARLVWGVSGYDRDEKYDLIAASVSEIASSALWSDIAPFMKVTLYRTAGIMAIYGVAAFLAVHWLTH
jgi:hypothetical protein